MGSDAKKPKNGTDSGRNNSPKKVSTVGIEEKAEHETAKQQQGRSFKFGQSTTHHKALAVYVGIVRFVCKTNVCITMVTSTGNDDEARELLRLLGMPFQQPETKAGAA